MKNITLFITSLSSGGAEHQLTLLSGMLCELGYNVSLVTFSTEADHYACDVWVKRIRLHHNGSAAGKLRAIYKYFFRIKTDCVISFGARENFFCLIPLWFRRSIKVIAGERCASYKKPQLYKRLNYAFLYKRANYIVPNSFTQQRDLSEIMPRQKSKIVTIPNFTDVNSYKSVFKEPGTPRRIGIFSRFAEQKNYRRFARAVQLLVEETDDNFEIHWYGNAMKDAKETNPDYTTFCDLIKMYRLETKLFLHEHVKNVAELILTFDIMCLPSLAEGFSNSVAEYICCGKPVVVSDVSDNSVMVHDGVNGFLFDPHCEKQMAEKMKEIILLPDNKLVGMGRESRSIAESLFDRDKFILAYTELIEK